MQKTDKVYYLDGIRGLAAFLVVLHHFGLAFFLAYHDWKPELSNWDGQDIAYGQSVFSVFTNGNFAVCIFFVLSGFVLSRQYFQKNDPSVLISAAIRRFPRLYIPIAFTICLSYLLLKTGAYQNRALSEITKSWWIRDFWITPILPSELHQLRISLFFRTMLKGDAFWNTAFWTIGIEFYGSLLVFAFLALTHQLRNRGFWLLCIAYYFISMDSPFYEAFILGVGLHFIKPWQLPSGKLRSLLAVFLLLAGLLLGSFPSSGSRQETIFRYFPDLIDLFSAEWLHVFGGVCLISSVLLSPRLQQFFSLRAFRFLGRISFSMYLIHVLLIGSLSSAIFLQLYPSMGYFPATAVTLVATLVVCFVASYLMTRFMDEKGIQVSKYIFNRYFRPAVPEKPCSAETLH